MHLRCTPNFNLGGYWRNSGVSFTRTAPGLLSYPNRHFIQVTGDPLINRVGPRPFHGRRKKRRENDDMNRAQFVSQIIPH